MSPVMSTVVGVLLIATGALWTLQGVGVVGDSPMTGVSLWAILGPVVLLTGVWLLVRGNRSRT